MKVIKKVISVCMMLIVSMTCFQPLMIYAEDEEITVDEIVEEKTTDDTLAEDTSYVVKEDENAEVVEDEIVDTVCKHYFNPEYDMNGYKLETINNIVEEIGEGPSFESDFEVINYIREQLINRVDEFSFRMNCSAVDPNEYAFDLFDKALVHTGIGNEGDYLRFQYGSMIAGYEIIEAYDTYSYVRIAFRCDVYTNYNQEQEVTNNVNALFENLGINSMSNPYDKLKALYDYVCTNVVYDFEHVSNSYYTPQFTAYAAIVQNIAVCQGYANLMYRLCLDAGIDCRIVTGKSNNENHAWNMVFIDGKYYFIDATWDSSNKQEGLEYEYFLKGSNSFLQDHALNDQGLSVTNGLIQAEDYVEEECLHEETELVGKVDVTCMENGYTGDVTCTSCHTVLTKGKTIKAKGHDIVEEGKVEPTCTQAGQTDTKKCKTCKEIFEESKPLEKKAHESYLEGYIQPTMYTDGYSGDLVCCSCKEIIEKGNVLPKLGKTVKSGTCGENIQWSMDANGTLRLWGTGEMTSYEYDKYPWNDLKDSINAVIIEDGITSITEDSFAGCLNLKNIHLGNTITTIDNFAFHNAKQLTTVNLPSSLEYLGQEAFAYTGIRSITIPENVWRINHAFDLCPNLREIYIKKNVDYGIYIFYDGLFLRNPSLESIYVEDGHTRFYSIDGVLYCENLLVSYPAGKKDKTFVIPSFVQKIQKFSFWGVQYLEHLVIPETVLYMYDSIEDCPNLRELILPNTLTLLNDSRDGLYTTNGMNCPKLEYLDNQTEQTVIINGFYTGEESTDDACREGHYVDASNPSISLREVPPHTKVVPSTDHDYSDWMVMQQPTSTNDGYKTRTCNRCNYVQKVIISNTSQGWKKQTDGSWKYYDNYQAVTDWKKINGLWYYFNSDGKMLTGWQKVNGNWYYLASDGSMQTYWKQVNGYWYYLGSNGRMVKGWLQINGIWYYFDNNGRMVTGWLQINGTWYYFDSHGATCYNWQQINGIWFYFGSNGKMVTGWQLINNYWYYFNGNGSMAKSWLQINSKWYYFNSNGTMAKGWLQVNGSWYWFDDHGVMVTGTQVINGKTYKFASNGTWIQ